MSDVSTDHWGKWITARAEAVGYKRQQDFADAVGCNRERIRRWQSMEVPPRRMRKGFDKKLATALETTPRIVFIDYQVIPPAQAARITMMEVPTEQFNAPPDSIDIGEIAHETLMRLLPSELEQVAEYALILGLSKNDGRRAEFENFLRSLRATGGHKKT